MASSRKRNVEIEFIVDDKRAAKSLQNIEGQLTKTGKAFSSMAKAAALGFGLNEAGQLAKDSIRAFSDLNESLNAVDKTFGGAAAGIKRLGEDAAQSIGLSNAEFNSLAVSFSAFAQTIASESGTSVIPVIDDITTRAADFASVMNLDVTEAARLFQSGLAGETEPLRKFGKDLSAAAVNANAYATGIAAAGKPLTEQQKILSRYDLLMKQTADTAGDFQDTAEDLANAQRTLAAETENAKAAFGESLAPAMEAAQKTGNDLLTVLGKIGEVAGSGQGAVGELAEGFGDVFNILTFGLVPALGAAADKIRDNEEAQRDLEQAQLDALYPSEAQIKVAESADRIFRQQAEAMAELADSTDDAATAAQELADIQKEAADPAFKLLSTLEKYDSAQDDYTEAISEFGHGSEQAMEAAIKLAEAEADLNQAGADFSAEGGAASIEALEELLTNAGVLPETIRAIIDAIKEYNDTPITRKSVFVPGVGNVTPGTGGSVGGDGTMIGFASGGVVPGPKGAPVPAIVHGGEEVLTPEQRGRSRGSTVINIHGGEITSRTWQEIQEMARRQ